MLEVGEFLATAERVDAGGSALDPMVVANLVAPADSGPVGRLSERERGVHDRCVHRSQAAQVRQSLTLGGLTDNEDGHRRVLAVLAYLDGAHQA